MDKIKVAVEMVKIDIPIVTRGMVGKQKGGMILQDTMDISVLTDRSFNTNNFSSAHYLHH